MDLKPENIDIDTFANYLANELTPEDSKSFEHWLSLSNANRIEFNRYQKIWQAAKAVKNKQEVDLDVAWDKISGQLFDTKTTSKGKIISLNKRFLSIAASILLLLVFSIGYFTYNTTPEIVYSNNVSTTIKEQKTITLADNSTIYLNQNSSLQFAENYKNTDTREVYLKGEAFFEVTKNASKPFIVNTKNAKVAVLGTSFNITETDSTIVVNVKTGKVSLKSNDNKNEVILVAGKSGMFTFSSNTIMTSENIDENYISWKTKQMVFNDVPLNEAIQIINKSYYSNISINDTAIGNYLVNAEFSDKPLKTIIKVIESTFDITASSKDNGQITLSGSTSK